MLIKCFTGTLYKGLLILIFVMIILEYFFGSITESKNYVLNNVNFGIQTSNNCSAFIHESFMGSSENEEVIESQAVTDDILSNNTHKNLTHLTVMFDTHSNSSSKENDIRNISSFTNSSGLPLCPEDPPDLQGVVEVVKYPVPSIRNLQKRFSWLKSGGHWFPSDCKVLKKVAIVIPFRCRGEHLLLFLQHMHPFLRKQQLDYTIFIVEQHGNGPFNRALLMNIGFTEALKKSNFDCFIFHDIDLLPENDKNLYTCPEQPRHMSVAVDIFKYRLPYKQIFGGACAISKKHFLLLNGFSNSFWGWGGEDDDMSNRIRHHNLYISRYPANIARYTMLTHKKDTPSSNRYDILKRGKLKYEEDGLNSLKYKVLENKEHLLYTWILVAIDAPS